MTIINKEKYEKLKVCNYDKEVIIDGELSPLVVSSWMIYGSSDLETNERLKWSEDLVDLNKLNPNVVLLALNAGNMAGMTYGGANSFFHQPGDSRILEYYDDSRLDVIKNTYMTDIIKFENDASAKVDNIYDEPKSKSLNPLGVISEAYANGKTISESKKDKLRMLFHNFETLYSELKLLKPEGNQVLVCLGGLSQQVAKGFIAWAQKEKNDNSFKQTETPLLHYSKANGFWNKNYEKVVEAVSKQIKDLL